GEEGTEPEHHPENADDREHRCEQLRETLLQGGRDVVHVIRHAAQEIAVGVAVEIPKWQPRELLLDLTSHAVDGPLSDAGHDVRLRPREELAQRAAEILGALDRRAEAHERATTLASLWPSIRAATLRPPHHHHAAAAPSCDSTISRYSALVRMRSSCAPLPTMRPSSST